MTIVRTPVRFAALAAAGLLLSPGPGARADGPAKASPPLGSKAKAFARNILLCYYSKLHPESPDLAKQWDKSRKLLSGLEGYSWKGLGKALNDTFIGIRPPEKGSGKLSVPIDGHPCKYLVKTPGGYAPGKPWPLMVALHGGGEGAGDGGEAMGTMGHMGNLGAIMVGPTAPGLPNGAWAYPRGYRTTRNIIREMAEMFHVDYNRIYTGGHSMGGYGGYWHAVWWPDRFAGYTSAAGGITAGVVNDLEILYNTPLHVVHGVLDTKQAYWSYVEMADKMIQNLDLKPRNYKFVGIPDAGHGFSSQYHKAACEWMFQFTRDPYPKKVVCTCPRVNNPDADREMPGTEKSGRAFWVEVLDRTVYDNDHAGKVVAEYDSAKNEITVTTPPVKRVFHPKADPAHPESHLIDMPNCVTKIGILLTDDMVSLDKPVKVTLNGKVAHEGVVQRSVDFLLERMIETEDPAMPFAARIELTHTPPKLNK